MHRSRDWVKHAVIGCLSIVLGGMLPASIVHADGGAVRTIASEDGMQISVFTSPVVLTAGEIDISILVQDGSSLAPLESVAEISVVPQGRVYGEVTVPATRELATNHLLLAGHVTLEAGVYDVVVKVVSGQRRGRVPFSMEVGPPPTRAENFWPWFAWPLLPIAVFVADRWRKRPRRFAPDTEVAI